MQVECLQITFLSFSLFFIILILLKMLGYCILVHFVHTQEVAVLWENFQLVCWYMYQIPLRALDTPFEFLCTNVHCLTLFLYIFSTCKTLFCCIFCFQVLADWSSYFELWKTIVSPNETCLCSNPELNLNSGTQDSCLSVACPIVHSAFNLEVFKPVTLQFPYQQQAVCHHCWWVVYWQGPQH